ncbi:MAG: class I SAM-dependent methyltransferase [Nitrospina sp.]|jgi:ubiquinone/menaquinone biosynthesis C-methylase UbiE|nr:class I SAM-dependent methyltransferase [Nitrospina sp.]
MSLRTFANLDLEMRRKKAKKIADILGDRVELNGAKVLDIGTGSGVCADYFANHVVGPDGMVAAVDRDDQRLLKNNYHFEIIEGVKLPFESNFFDIVISNHVIEHVGFFSEQLMHLREISRVLKRTGTLYLAFPNKYTLIEPHYKLPFLSWLPQQFSDGYLKLTGRGKVFDCHAPSLSRFADLLKEAELSGEEITEEILAYVVVPEKPYFQRKMVKKVRVFIQQSVENGF